MGFQRSSSFFLLAGLALNGVASAPTATQEKVSQLLMQPVGMAQLDLLSAPDMKFDFSTQPNFTFSPGGVTVADTDVYPAVTGRGMSLAVANLGPCAMLPPHLHPRADNFGVVISSDPNATVDTYMIQENSAPVIHETLKVMQMTIFPRGSMHSMVNNGCSNVQVVIARNSENSGTLTVANNFYRMSPDVIGTVMGDSDAQLNEAANRIPAIGTSANAGSQACLSKCGIPN